MKRNITHIALTPTLILSPRGRLAQEFMHKGQGRGKAPWGVKEETMVSAWTCLEGDSPVVITKVSDTWSRDAQALT